MTKRRSSRRNAVQGGDFSTYYLRPEGIQYTSTLMKTSLTEADPEDECPITQEKIVDAYLDFIPGETIIQHQPNLKKMTLDCQHSFSALPLLYHFLTNGMLCPLCRKGFSETLSDISLPDHVRDRMKEHARELHNRRQQELARDDLHMAMMISRGDIVDSIMVIEPSLVDLVHAHPLTMVIYAHSGPRGNETRALFSFPLNSNLQAPPYGSLLPPERYSPYLVASLPRSSIREAQRLLNSISYVHRFTFVISARDTFDNILEVVRSPVVDITQRQNRPGVFLGERHDLEHGHLELNILSQNGRSHQLQELSWVISEERATVLLTELIYHRVGTLIQLDGVSIMAERVD